MVRRLVIDREKLLVSKAGNDVLNPSLADDDKIFDSRWPFSLGILQRGYYLGDEIPPNSSPFVTSHFFGERESRPLLVTEVVPREGAARLGGSGAASSIDTDSLNYGFASFYKKGVDTDFTSVYSQNIEVFTDRFEVTWTGYNSGFRTLPFSWFILAVPAAQQ